MLPCSLNPAGTSENSTTYAQTIATASPNQHGKWLVSRSTFGPNAAVTTAATSGATGISHMTSMLNVFRHHVRT